MAGVSGLFGLDENLNISDVNFDKEQRIMQINIADHEGMIIWDGVYYFALSDYPNISPWELKKLLAFIEYVFDGYHPAKIKDEFLISDYLYACIVPEHYKNEIKKLVQMEISDKVFYIPQNGLGLWDWANKIYEFVEKI